jgi:hypothetical protein
LKENPGYILKRGRDGIEDGREGHIYMLKTDRISCLKLRARKPTGCN